jgi:hypothetical protein
MNRNGKGSLQRGTSSDERRRFEEGYERIFGKPKAEPASVRAKRSPPKTRVSP